MIHEPSYTLFTHFTDGTGEYHDFPTWAAAKQALDAVKSDDHTLHAKLKLYTNFEDVFIVDEWSHPSVFDLSKSATYE